MNILLQHTKTTKAEAIVDLGFLFVAVAHVYNMPANKSLYALLACG